MQPGEKITLMFGHGVVLTETREPRADERDQTRQPIWTFVWTNAGADGMSRVRLDEEGIHWLRGHYTPDAPEVSAARVAQALGKPAAEPRSKPAITGKTVGTILGNAIGTIAADMIHKMIKGE
jgi:hypothetical protein